MNEKTNTISNNTQGNLNLKYLIQDTPKQSFPYHIVILVLLVLFIIPFSLWILYKKSQKPMITHTVVKGERLRTIAVKYYQNPKHWKKIFLANRKKLFNRTELIEGEKLIIPILKEKK